MYIVILVVVAMDFSARDRDLKKNESSGSVSAKISGIDQAPAYNMKYVKRVDMEPNIQDTLDAGTRGPNLECVQKKKGNLQIDAKNIHAETQTKKEGFDDSDTKNEVSIEGSA